MVPEQARERGGGELAIDAARQVRRLVAAAALDVVTARALLGREKSLATAGIARGGIGCQRRRREKNARGQHSCHRHDSSPTASV